MSLEEAQRDIEKSFGKRSLVKMSEKPEMDVTALPTGILPLDVALGIGGLPSGRIIELFGPEMSGKSTIAIHAVAETQKNGGICAYIDAEHSLDPVYAEAIGVDVDNLLISQPSTAEEGLGIVDKLAKYNAVDLIVLDSVAALSPRAEIEGAIGDAHMGLQARLMGQALRKITANLSKSKTTIIFINQLREKIGVMFGSPEITPGGKALKFYSSIRMDVRRLESIKMGDEVIGGRAKIKIVKNKVSPPFRQVEVDILFGEGISKEGSILDIAVDKGIVDRSGAWYSYNGDSLGQGKENVKEFLKDNPIIYKELSEKILTTLE